MMTRGEVVAKYGPIDFSARVWPKQHEFMTMLDVSSLGLPWKVDGGGAVNHIFCNVDFAKPLFNALSTVKKLHLDSLLHTYDGCFNIRYSRGTPLISAHAYGLAIDINASQNPLGADAAIHIGNHRAQFYDHPEFVKCFTDQGIHWGGNFGGRKDPMHFTLPGF